MAEGITWEEAQRKAAEHCAGPWPAELIRDFWRGRVAADYFQKSRADAASANLAEMTKERDALKAQLEGAVMVAGKLAERYDHGDVIGKLQAEIVKLEKERGEFRKLAQDRAKRLVDLDREAQKYCDRWVEAGTKLSVTEGKWATAEMARRAAEESLRDARGAVGLLTSESEGLTKAYHEAKEEAAAQRRRADMNAEAALAWAKKADAFGLDDVAPPSPAALAAAWDSVAGRATVTFRVFTLD